MSAGLLLFDATHTSHTAAQTGIQRVCRALFAELQPGHGVAPVCFDPHLNGWRPLAPGELAGLHDRSGQAGNSRGARWTLSQKISGTARRWVGAGPVLPPATGLICPEIFSARAGSRLAELLAVVAGPRVAIFYDAIPLKFPELTPLTTVARFPVYLRELLLFDGIAAISEDSAASLRDYWRWLGVDRAPPVHAIPLGIDRPLAPAAGERAPVPTPPRLLCVGTIEGRKNHLALLDACERLWGEGEAFELELIGLPRPDTAAAALAKIQALRASGRPLIFRGSVSEATLRQAYAGASFTVYPSLIEGFGLPVLESLQHGKPCICSGGGALGESARGGGCLALDSVDPASLAFAIRHLLQDSAELTALSAAARRRTFKTWGDYARELTAWMHTLPRRP